MTQIAAIIIGRNEGARLIACLEALNSVIPRMIYVDSGSSDGSVAAAEACGAEVVALDMDQAFTAARARNAGLDHLRATGALPEFVQFLDGDCVLDPGWTSKALAFLTANPGFGVVCGRRRERFPEASLYNRLIDREWDTPIGEARSCGGDALMRMAALEAVDGYNPALIAGEEPELCVRLRQAGWKVMRLDAEMTLHDAAITQFSQWWKRTKRAGHAYAEGAALHGAPPERHNVAQTKRALIWGVVLPVAILALAFFVPWALALLLIYPVQIARLARRSGDLTEAVFLTLGKFAEGQGVLAYWINRLRGAQAQIMEYKA